MTKLTCRYSAALHSGRCNALSGFVIMFQSNEVPIPSAWVIFRQIQEHVFPTVRRLHIVDSTTKCKERNEVAKKSTSLLSVLIPKSCFTLATLTLLLFIAVDSPRFKLLLVTSSRGISCLALYEL
jgi:hypothetical protein